MGDWTYRKRDARCIGIKGKWWLWEGFLADVSGKIHGLVEDAGDLNLAGLDSVNEEVLAAAKGPAALHDFMVSFTAGSKWIFCDALHCRF
jgi:hypothetical protein